MVKFVKKLFPMSKPLILITNDDGIAAPGLRFLTRIMMTLGRVVVVAPDKPQSAMGHAITVGHPLRLARLKHENHHKEYSCSGTPVDCVKIAIDKILGRKPDLLVSGVNHGANTSVNIIYSGTMSAALEGAMVRVPSIGFSLNEYANDADFSHTEKYIGIIARNVLQHGLPDDTCLNVNFPARSSRKIKGIKVCRQARGHWKEEFDERTDPHGRKYYWLTGVFENPDTAHDTDEWALSQNYVSVVPVQFDFTAHQAIHEINQWRFDD